MNNETKTPRTDSGRMSVCNDIIRLNPNGELVSASLAEQLGIDLGARWGNEIDSTNHS